MKNIFLRSLILGAGYLSPLIAIAGDIDIVTPLVPISVQLPNMLEGWGFSVEGTALRAYDNNLTYFSQAITTAGVIVDPSLNTNTSYQQYEPLDGIYSFGLHVGVDYTFHDYANVLKLYYEHLFARTASDNFVDSEIFPETPTLETLSIASGSIKQKLDAITLISEQHLLIGPFWEATFSGGARFTHVSQMLHTTSSLTSDNVSLDVFTTDTTSDYSMQFNGVGPVAGLGTLFHLFPSLTLGVEGQLAALIGRNKINTSFNIINLTNNVATFNGDFINQVNEIYSVVPEAYLRIYGNYLYTFSNASELEIEAGWRVNQFFNLRTFDSDYTSQNTTTSDDIGFSGPYLLVHYKI